MRQRTYICIDLKSFFASVECVERGLDPMATNLVVADPDRSDKTICLAITPAMKKLGIPNRCRVFEIPKHISYIMAPPRMQTYVNYSADIYAIYLKYISKDDIHIYSIDEAFMDVTEYLTLYQTTAKELGVRIMDDIYHTLGIRATCGIGSNLYLTKIALDITAKHAPDFIGELDEETYRQTLWDHRPLTDFWRIGAGTVNRLASHGMFTMRDVANMDENVLYQLFGIDAELLIDHAWGREPVTISDIKSYSSATHSLTSGQVLMSDYAYEDAMLIVKEMFDLLCLDLVSKNLVTKSISLRIVYAKDAHCSDSKGTASLSDYTNADIVILPEATKLFRQITNRLLKIRKIYVAVNNIVPEEYVQYSFLSNTEDLIKNRKLQQAVLSLKEKFGKNAVLKGMNLEEHSTAMERNHQMGGHKSGE